VKQIFSELSVIVDVRFGTLQVHVIKFVPSLFSAGRQTTLVLTVVLSVRVCDPRL